MKNFFSYPLFLVLLLCFIGSILYGSLLRHHYLGGERAKSLQKIAVFFAEIPSIAKDMVDSKSLNPNKPPLLTKHKNKKKFEQFIENKRNALLVLPRYVHSEGRSLIDIVDLNNFEIIHTYKHDIDEMNNQILNNNKYSINSAEPKIRFLYWHPLLLENGSIMSFSGLSESFKIDFCSNLEWINYDGKLHHSQMIDHNGDVWAGGRAKPVSRYVKKYSLENFNDDSIVKISTDGEILYNKSISEILIENNIVPDNFPLVSSLSNEFDPIHVNDVEPTFNDTEYWKQGDVFISIRHHSSIIHYRPNTNKVINYITGPFSQQHDVDIISDKEISIFNNNNFYVDNQFSEIVIYNFETKKFRKLFNNQLQEENFKTPAEGLSHIFEDGSLMVEEQMHGRIILFNNKGEKEWEFVNKDKNDDIGIISWSRVIEDDIFIKKFKSLVENKKCTN